MHCGISYVQNTAYFMFWYLMFCICSKQIYSYTGILYFLTLYYYCPVQFLEQHVRTYSRCFAKLLRHAYWTEKVHSYVMNFQRTLSPFRMRIVHLPMRCHIFDWFIAFENGFTTEEGLQEWPRYCADFCILRPGSHRWSFSMDIHPITFLNVLLWHCCS